MPLGRGGFNSQSRRTGLGVRHCYSSFVQGMVYSKLSTRFPSEAMEFGSGFEVYVIHRISLSLPMPCFVLVSYNRGLLDAQRVVLVQ